MEIVVDRHIEDVFDYLADPRVEPRWRARVVSVEQVEGDGPGPGARYDVVARAGRLRRPRHTTRTCIAWERPARIAWRDDDGAETTFALESVWTATRITHIGGAERGDLGDLKRTLERG
jgi:uncharacterized protein YndB with AHSA1/START domain